MKPLEEQIEGLDLHSWNKSRTQKYYKKYGKRVCWRCMTVKLMKSFYHSGSPQKVNEHTTDRIRLNNHARRMGWWKAIKPLTNADLDPAGLCKTCHNEDMKKMYGKNWKVNL